MYVGMQCDTALREVRYVWHQILTWRIDSLVSLIHDIDEGVEDAPACSRTLWRWGGVTVNLNLKNNNRN